MKTRTSSSLLEFQTSRVSEYQVLYRLEHQTPDQTGRSGQRSRDKRTEAEDGTDGNAGIALCAPVQRRDSDREDAMMR
eukprot:scaffold3350_cov268-Pinguiococcus_pyrenoidosus.AAC.18